MFSKLILAVAGMFTRIALVTRTNFCLILTLITFHTQFHLKYNCNCNKLLSKVTSRDCLVYFQLKCSDSGDVCYIVLFSLNCKPRK